MMKTINRHFFLVLLFVMLQFSSALCQQDYIITETNDTICGSITQSFFLFGNKIKIRTNTGKRRVDYSQMREYRRNGVKFMKAKKTDVKGKLLTYHCKVLVDGNMRLLEETQQEGAEYFVYYNEKFWQVNCKYFSNEIWEFLTQCQEFSKMYSDYRTNIKAENVMLFPGQRKIWIEMINYRNQQCT